MACTEHDKNDALGYLATLDCVHCGLCIEHCPTYRVSGRESASPRGRIYTMRALLEGRIEATPDLEEDLDSCLLCRACESACPSGVPYAAVATEIRARLRKRGFFRRLLMDRILIHPKRLALLSGFTASAQKLGLLVLGSKLPGALGRLSAYAPKVPPRQDRRRLPEELPAMGEELGCVSFLEGCIMGELFGRINRDTVRLLQAAGYRVLVPKAQGCCGALHEHDGDLETATRLSRANAAAFSNPKVEAIVNNSAGCGAMLKDSAALLPEDPKAETMANKSVDFTRFLLEKGQRLAFNPRPERFSYDAPCHLHHAQKETSAPLELLAKIPGFIHVPMRGAERCCGAAGIYNMDQPEMSQAILEEKLDALEDCGVKLLISGNPGCLMQWRQGIARRGLDLRAEHPATILASCLPE